MAALTENPPAQRSSLGLLLVFLSGVMWSTVGLGIRLIEDAQVWQILFTRSFGLSLLLYVVIRIRTGQSPWRLVRRAGLSGVVGALSLVLAYAGGIYAIQTTSVANAMLLFATAPFMTAILGLVILRESVRWQTWAAIALAGVGVLIMVSGDTGAGSLSGELAALASAFGFAVFTITLRRGKHTEMLPCVFLSGLFAIILMGMICLWLGLPLVLGPRDGSIALFMGVFQVGAGLVLYTLGSKTVPAAELTLLSLAEVVLAPLWVWLLLAETPAAMTLLGGAILLLAITGNALSGTRRRKAPVRPV